MGFVNRQAQKANRPAAEVTATGRSFSLLHGRYLSTAGVRRTDQDRLVVRFLVVRFFGDRVAVFLAPVFFFVERVAFFVPVRFVVARFLVVRFLVVRFFGDRVAFFFVVVRFFVAVRFLVDRVAFFGERFVVFLATFFFGAIFLPPVLWIP